MKFFPDAIARKVAEQGLLASKHSPTILFGVGVVGMVGSTVLACRATLKLDEVLDEIDANKAKAQEVKTLVEAGAGDVSYPDDEFQQDLTIIRVQGLAKVVKLYAPSVLLGAASIACLTKSHNILMDRNAALTAAYIAVDEAFKRYRGRIVAKYGEAEDRHFLYETEAVDVIDEETGKTVVTTMITDTPGAPYARWWAEWSTPNWSRWPEANLAYLKNQQNYWNDKLRARGHVFLNEVYADLGLSHTEAGAVVGWRWNKNSGDNFIDFGCWDEDGRAFFVGEDDAVMLNFNVEGPIYKLIEEPS